MSYASRKVADGVSVKVVGEENVVLVFEDGSLDEPWLWGFPSRHEFGTFVSALQAFYVEVRP